MQTFKTRGVIIGATENGESDKRLVVLCKGHGRVQIHARGARKPKSKFMATAQLFTYADMLIADGRSFKSLAQAEVIESFYALRTDYERLCTAHLIAEICEKTVLEDQPCDDLLLLVLRAFSYLKIEHPPLLVLCTFLFRFYSCQGLTPQVDECVICGTPLDLAANFNAEGFLCRTHTHTGSIMPLSPASVQAIRHVLHSELRTAFAFTAHASVLRELSIAARFLWEHHFGWKLKSEAFL